MGYSAHVNIPKNVPAVITTVGPHLHHGWMQITVKFTKLAAKGLYVCVFTQPFTLEAGVEAQGRGLAWRGSAGMTGIDRGWKGRGNSGR